MLDNFKDVAETLRNRFAESPLGKQLEGMDFDNIDNTGDSSLDAYVSDVPDELCDDSSLESYADSDDSNDAASEYGDDGTRE